MLAIVEGYDDDLAAASMIADHYASLDIQGDYQRRISANTRRRQKSELEVFCEYLAQAHVRRTGDEMFSGLNAWRGISAGLIKGFITWRIKSGAVMNTVNIRLATIKHYCHLATDATVLTAQQHAMIALVKGYSHKAGRNIDRERLITRVGAKNAEPTVISTAHAALLKRQPDDTRIGRRDALLMCLLLDHGLRCSEVAALQVQNVDLVAGTITFYCEKVDKEQTHDLTADALAAARAYLPEVAGQQYLFPGYRHKETAAARPMNVRAINDRVGILGKRIGIDALSPHDCRHYWATEAMKHNTSIDRLQEAGCWSSPTMPLRYANKARKANEGVKLR